MRPKADARRDRRRPPPGIVSDRSLASTLWMTTAFPSVSLHARKHKPLPFTRNSGCNTPPQAVIAIMKVDNHCKHRTKKQKAFFLQHCLGANSQNAEGRSDGRAGQCRSSGTLFPRTRKEATVVDTHATLTGADHGQQIVLDRKAVRIKAEPHPGSKALTTLAAQRCPC